VIRQDKELMTDTTVISWHFGRLAVGTSTLETCSPTDPEYTNLRTMIFVKWHTHSSFLVARN
jgi:hypothetical protein